MLIMAPWGQHAAIVVAWLGRVRQRVLRELDDALPMSPDQRAARDWTGETADEAGRRLRLSSICSGSAAKAAPLITGCASGEDRRGATRWRLILIAIGLRLLVLAHVGRGDLPDAGYSG